MVAHRSTIDQRFAEAWVNRPHAICGVRLAPYCLHHLLFLELTGNPLLGRSAGGSISWAHLLHALAICSAPYEAELPEPPAVRWRLWLFWHTALAALLWRPQSRRRLPFALRRYHVSRLLLRRACRQFRTYQNDFLSEPDLFFNRDGRDLSAPAILGKAVFLQRVCGIDEKRAWTMPVGKALWTYASALEQEAPGMVSLCDEEESNFWDDVAAIQRGDRPLPPEVEAAATQPPADRGRIDPSVFGL